MPNSTVGTAQTGNITPEIVAANALGYLPKYMNLAKTVSRDYEEEVANYGDTVDVGVRGALSANAKTDAENVTLQQPSATKKSIVLDQHWEVTFSPTDVARAFSRPDILAGYMDDAAKVLAEKIEGSIAAKYTVAGLAVNATAASASTFLAKMREARRKLITNKVAQNEALFAYFSEYAIEELLNSEQMDAADKAGTNRPLMEGSIARVAGFNMFESQLVVGTGSPSTQHNLMYTKDALALVMRPLPTDAERFGGAKQAVVRDPQTGIAMRVTMSYNANALAPQITLDALWGVAGLRTEHLVDFTTQA